MLLLDIVYIFSTARMYCNYYDLRKIEIDILYIRNYSQYFYSFFLEMYEMDFLIPS